MEIIAAQTSGFCFGVKHAVDSAYQLLDQNEINRAAGQQPTQSTYMLGELIHNQTVLNELNARGMTKVDDVADLPYGAQVVIRAHGVPPQTLEALALKGCEIFDCTCPYVNKIHRIVRLASENNETIIIAGNPGHPEVVGIQGESQNPTILLSKRTQAGEMIFPDAPAILVAQTTFSYEEYLAIQAIVKNKIANVRIFDTICSTTEVRQKEAKEIAQRVDLMLVIGSRNSSNTMKLVDVCKQQCGETFLIENPIDVRPLLVGRDLKALKVGITAGASTPERIIREVIQEMTEQEVLTNQQEHGDVSFTDFIDNIPQLKRGATVKGVIVRYDNENVYVDVRDKSEGKIPRHEFDADPDFDLDQAIANHTEIDVYVRNIRNTDMTKEIVLSKARVDFGKYKGLIEDAFANKTPIQVKVINVVKDGVIATYGGVDIYIHRTQLEMNIVNDLDAYRGQTLEILVTQYDPDKKRLRVSGSRRALISTARKEKADEIWGQIEAGKEFDGVVRSLTTFGAFVDIGGVDGLVHVSELSWNRIHHPSEVVSVGDPIHVYVKDFDVEKKRISLGYKRATDDPYHDVESQFPVGTIVHGRVVRMFQFGAFIELAPGVDALCHISQISDVRLNKPEEVLVEGMEIDARVLEVSNEKRRISISIKEVEPINPVRADEVYEAAPEVVAPAAPAVEAAPVATEEALEAAEAAPVATEETPEAAE
ncbi:MAG: bifunctional 4-hydroxy-3-methylbut-2-enyl diphosphate reductase/30S ribosomal protein S1 [Eubacteriales bacterium]|nr:bifunctional 4-hydroxy-3-methylbut-2-enyl diphosphate reductase/30S ribosomal protein S1 [Eubacteriales bacterium]